MKIDLKIFLNVCMLKDSLIKKITIKIKDYDCVIVFISYELYCLFLTIIYKENKTFGTKQIVLKDNHDDIYRKHC